LCSAATYCWMKTCEPLWRIWGSPRHWAARRARLWAERAYMQVRPRLPPALVLCLKSAASWWAHAIPMSVPFAAAPEQLMGEQCTVQSDIYSLGVLLIELTTLHLGRKRGEWQLPHAPRDCPQVRRQHGRMGAGWQ
jgi:hypothetical protein